MLQRFLEQAGADEPVFITDVREAFLKNGSRPFHLHVHLYDGSVRRFEVLLPETGTQEERSRLMSTQSSLVR